VVHENHKYYTTNIACMEILSRNW